MRRKLYRYITSIMVVIIATCIMLCNTTPAGAISNDELTKKTLLNALKTCGTTEYFKSTLYPDTISDAYNWSDLGILFTSKGSADGTIRVPNLVGNTIRDGNVSCKQVLEGYHKNSQDLKGLAEYAGKTITKSKLTNIGYRSADVTKAATLTQECMQITYEYEYKKLFGGTEWKSGNTKKYCFWVADGKIGISPSGDHNVAVSGKNTGNVVLSGSYDKGYWLSLYIIDGAGAGKTKSILYSNAGEGDREWASFKSGFDNAASSINSTDGYRNAKLNFTKGTDIPPESTDTVTTTLQFGGSSSKLDLLHFFAGSSATWDSIKFSEADKKALLRAYVQQEIDAGTVKLGTCDTLEKTIANQGDSELYVYQPNTSRDSYCVLEGGSSVTKKFNAPRASMDILYPESFLTIVTSLMPKEVTDKNYAIRHPETTGSSGTTGDADGDVICSKAAASLGWITCSVIKGVGNSVSSIYDMIEESFLRTDASFVARMVMKGDKEVESPTYSTWKKFQWFANIGFVIVLLVIIISQVTGFGVNNYGIKKILPSLIVVAILVNLSFFICQIAVDLSNLLGYELRERFLEFGRSITIDPDFADGSVGSIVGFVVDTIFTTGTLLGVRAVLFSNFGAWIWPFLVSLLSVAIGILFFFIILGIRQTGIIILVVLSPVAIVCYALPNTKSFFDRWRKMLTSLLVVYPVCGLLMGGGQFVSRLMLSNVGAETTGSIAQMSSMLFFGAVGSGISSFFYVLVAMLIQVVPFFFIPSIVKSSMAAMGNLGTKLSNFGRGLSKTATGTIRKSDGYKDRVARGKAWDANRKLDPWYNKSNRFARVAGKPFRMADRAGEKVRSLNNPLSRKMNDSYIRRRANQINAVAARNDADRRARMTVTSGLEGAERRQDEELRKFYANTYSGDTAFKNDFDRQEAEYENAIEEVDKNPTSVEAIAKLRGLQDVIGSTPDGQDRIQRVLNRRLFNEQEAASTAGRPPVLSAGMQAAKDTLMGDHSGFKSGNRGLAATLKDMDASGKVFTKGTFAKLREDEHGNAIYGNTHYGAQTAKGSAYELANANDDTLDNTLQSISSMNDKQLMDIYRNASEAITNDTIPVKPENEDKLNKIRQEAWSRIQANTAGSSDYYDDQGRHFEHNVGSFYDYVDNSGTKHRYKRDASTGDFKEMGGAGEVISSAQMMSAQDNFTSQYGNSYRELHAGDSYKIDHRRYVHAEMPHGWHQRKDGNWYNGNTRLTPDEIARAEEIRRYNNQVDIHNGT